tara:strand:- start:232 stop:420 length:189 start_codon:yes stop_codon:yes gene_type:complete
LPVHEQQELDDFVYLGDSLDAVAGTGSDGLLVRVLDEALPAFSQEDAAIAFLVVQNRFGHLL